MAESVLERMRSDWNDRASEDAYYYAAFGRRRQEDTEFFQTAEEVLAWLRHEMRRLPVPPQECRALEIGCGPARLMRPLSASFAEVHGVDVSDRMIELARRNLAGIENAHVNASSGADLSGFADGSIDFVYSYAVFQHIPSREVVLQYLREAGRVLKTNGILTCQLNGLPQDAPEFSTWDGARVSASTLVALARELDCQILALDGIDGRYMWTTWRKRSPGWTEAAAKGFPPCEILGVRSAAGHNRIPAGRVGDASITVKGVNPNWDVSELTASIGGQSANIRLIHIPAADGVGDLTLFTPSLAASHSTDVQLFWRGNPVSARLPIEVANIESDGPTVVQLTDGVNILSGRNVVSRFVKVLLDDVTEPGQLRADVNGRPVNCSPSSCVDHQKARYEFNLFLPGSIGAGSHRIDILQGSRPVATRRIMVGILQAPDVFRSTAPGDRLLECTRGGEWVAITIRDGAQRTASEPFAAEASRLPFGDGQFAGIAYRSDIEKADWRELRRVLKEEGAVYVETSTAEAGSEIGARLGLPCRWKRDLARPIGSRRPIATTRQLTIAGRAWTLWRALLRIVDRRFGTRMARGGLGFCFGGQPNAPDLRARLNGCIRCGDVASSDQLAAAGPPILRFGLSIYLCPSCGAPNILTADS
jgi:SAM-dependent methyltransferase